MDDPYINVADLEKLTSWKNAALAYQGEVYDVSEFIDKHPGGSDQLKMAAGRDVTHLFNSYHSKKTRKLLAQKCKHIGRLEESESIPKLSEKDELYEKIEERLYEYLRSNKIDPKWNVPFFCVGFLVVLATLFLWYLTILSAHQGYPMVISACLSMMYGFSSAIVTLNLSHDISHFAWTHWPWFWKWVGNLLCCVHGLSSYVWKYKHIVGHHVHTNHDLLDPDVSTAKVDMWRIKQFQEWCPHYVYQHIYMPILYTLVSILMKLQDFHSIFVQRRSNVLMNPPTSEDVFVFLTAKILHVCYRFILPFPYVSLPYLLLLNLLSELVMGFWLGFVTEVNHINSDVLFLEQRLSYSDMSWSELQVATTVDYATDSVVWGFLSGGLNTQVAHHLFPWVMVVYYREITPIIKQTCEEFGVEYKSYGGMWEIWCSHTNYLKRLGQAKAGDKKE